MATSEKTKRTFRKPSPVEGIKTDSGGLCGTLRDELALPTPNVTNAGEQVLKFHGVYQQDDRDTRTARKKAGLDKDHSFMVRTKFPGGRISAEQYLVCDELAGRFGFNDLRVTSRQDLQVRGVAKGDLRPLLNGLNRLAQVTTFGACGDVVRNVMAPAVADIDPRYATIHGDLLGLADRISAQLLPKTTSYFDLWIDDRAVEFDEDGSLRYRDQRPAEPADEPLYGKTYLPRKFKIALATDFDNSVDVFTNDVGIIAVTEGGTVSGFEILVGGGLGYTHGKKATYSRLGTPFAFVGEDDLIDLLEAVVRVQRDHGCRTDRRHGRLKYLIDGQGIEWFRARVEEAAGRRFPPSRGIVPSAQPDYLGWSKQTRAGLNYVGAWVENGRIKDFPGGSQFKTGFRDLIARFKPSVRFTPHHNVILADIPDDDVPHVQALLDHYRIPTDRGISPLRRTEMACPALPLCPLALAESERVMPSIAQALEEAGHAREEVVIRMSGCPNNCSRPRSAELGIIGCGANRYHIYVGGSGIGTRLNEPVIERLPGDEVTGVLNRLLDLWKSERDDRERFGDWAHRVGAGDLRERLAPEAASRLPAKGNLA